MQHTIVLRDGHNIDVRVGFYAIGKRVQCCASGANEYPFFSFGFRFECIVKLGKVKGEICAIHLERGCQAPAVLV